MPAVPDDLPAGPRPMVAVVRARIGHEPQLATAHVEQFLSQAAQHSTTGADGLVQLIELTTLLGDNSET